MPRFLHKSPQYFFPSNNNAYRPHILKKPWLIFFLTIVLTSETVLVVGFLARQSLSELVGAVSPGVVIALTNTQRTEEALSQVTENALLDKAAQAKAEDMASLGYFAHVSPTGKEPWVWIQEAGYTYQYAGENLAVRFDNSSDVVRAWMASPSHRANIVKPVYTDIGVGVADGVYQGSPATFVVQYFGTPLAAAHTGSSAIKKETEQTPPVATASPASVQIAGASVAPPTPSGGMSTYLRAFFEAIQTTDSTTTLVLAAVASVLVIVLALTFFMHLQIQPADMLAGGAVVAAIALFFLTANTYLLSSHSASQSASVFSGIPTIDGIMVTPEAAYTEQR